MSAFSGESKSADRLGRALAAGDGQDMRCYSGMQAVQAKIEEQREKGKRKYLGQLKMKDAQGPSWHLPRINWRQDTSGTTGRGPDRRRQARLRAPGARAGSVGTGPNETRRDRPERGRQRYNCPLQRGMYICALRKVPHGKGHVGGVGRSQHLLVQMKAEAADRVYDSSTDEWVSGRLRHAMQQASNNPC